MPYKIVKAFGKKQVVWEDEPVDENFEVHSKCECGKEFILSPKSTGRGKHELTDVMKHIHECEGQINTKAIELKRNINTTK